MLIELRSYGDTSAALRHIKFNRELHEYTLPSFFPPPDQESTEFELMTRHPILYPVSIPLDFPQPAEARLPQTESELFGGGQSDSPSSGSYWRLETSPLGDLPMSIDPGIAPLELEPSQTQTSYDPRLERVNFSNWTDVPITPSQAAQAISDYLRLDHPVFGFFDADSFLNDLSGGGTRFCSPLLVNALLGWRHVSNVMA